MKLEKTKNLMNKEPNQKTLIPKFERLKKQIIDLEFIENNIEYNQGRLTPEDRLSEPVTFSEQSYGAQFSNPNPFGILGETEGGHVKYSGKIRKVYIGKRGGKYIKCKGKKVYL